MKITKQLLEQIIKEEINGIDEEISLRSQAGVQKRELEKIYKFLEMQMQE